MTDKELKTINMLVLKSNLGQINWHLDEAGDPFTLLAGYSVGVDRGRDQEGDEYLAFAIRKQVDGQPTTVLVLEHFYRGEIYMQLAKLRELAMRNIRGVDTAVSEILDSLRELD